MAAVLTMQSTGAALHPFFTRPANPTEPQAGESINAAQHEEHEELDQYPGGGDGATDAKKGPLRAKREMKSKDGKAQRTLAQVLRPTLPGSAQQTDDDGALPDSEGAGEAPASGSAVQALAPGSNMQALAPGQQVEATCAAPATPTSAKKRDPQTVLHTPERYQPSHVLIPLSPSRCSEKREAPWDFDHALPSTPPKKMMRLGKGGKLASPSIVPKKEETVQEESAGKRRGRPRKAKEQPPTTRIVVCPYGRVWSLDDRNSFGQRICQVLSGEERITLPQTAPKKQRTPKKPKKPTHPFFGVKPKETRALKPPSPRKTAAITPGKLRAQAMQDHCPKHPDETQHPMGSALLRDRLMVRHPRAREPPWPSKEQVHVRGLDLEQVPVHEQDSRAQGKRKRKQQLPMHGSSTSILDSFTSTLEPEAEPELQSDGYYTPRSDIRLPKRHLMSGLELAARIKPEIQAYLPDPASLANGLSHPDLLESTAHPGLLKLYSALPTHLSAFDHCQGEVQGWAHKHAPMRVCEVLQPTREMTVLKDWLQSLTVNAVGKASSIKPASRTVGKPKRKRQRKDNDLNDFLVESGDEGYEMDTLTDPEDQVPAGGKRSLQSVVQTLNGQSKLSNAVLLSGPHGCGKTAAAYAAAKELGFQVFEIGSAERRSGRDVLDRVGDMTENHIVKNHGIDPGELSASEDRGHMEAAFQKDLESGRQGKMMAFFKAKPPRSSTTVKSKARSAEAETLQKLQQALKKPIKEQQQSLILLEEVDILFKEDKEFWTTVLKLMATSKRPFIMTCNDEDLVPLQAMSLHAILRLSPPPMDLAVDYMLLVAALEGHLLKRDALASLYDAQKQDLRASIAELDFWCQMAIGDPKGGLNWIYQRYPPGCDIDQHGHRVRYISEDTYRSGMGLTQPRDNIDEDSVLCAWRDFDVHPTALLGWDHGFHGSVADLEIMAPGVPSTNPSTIEQMSKFADCLSASDVYTTKDTTDTTLPKLPEKARLQYIEGLQLLESNTRTDYAGLTSQLCVTSTLLAYKSYSPEHAVEHALQSRNLLAHIRSSSSTFTDHTLTRHSFNCFDILATPSTSRLSAPPGLEITTFDGPLAPIALDIAPYVRSIVHYDNVLAEQRAALGGHDRASKQGRKTRASRSALEGSQRSDTRREKWFGRDLDDAAILATGGNGWPLLVQGVEQDGDYAPPASSVESAGTVGTC